MKTNEKIKDLENQIADLKKDRRETFARITGVSKDKISILNDNWIVFKCKNIEDVRDVLNNIQPFKNGWKINGNYIKSLYKIDIKNDYYNRLLRIQFQTAPGLEVWIEIDFTDLPDWFKDTYFTETERPLYETEKHYVNIPSHYKKFKNIRIQAFKFWSQTISWHGGDETVIDEVAIEEMIETIKEV